MICCPQHHIQVRFGEHLWTHFWRHFTTISFRRVWNLVHNIGCNFQVADRPGSTMHNKKSSLRPGSRGPIRKARLHTSLNILIFLSTRLVCCDLTEQMINLTPGRVWVRFENWDKWSVTTVFNFAPVLAWSNSKPIWMPFLVADGKGILYIKL